MPKTVVIKLHGKPFSTKQPSKAVARICKHLDGCPKDEVFPHDEVAVRLGLYSKFIVHNLNSYQELSPYTTIVGRQRYVGHPAAIAELKRQTGTE